MIWVHTVCHRGFLNISADDYCWDLGIKGKSDLVTGDLESQLADLKEKIERLEEERQAVDESLAEACQERDDLQKVVNDLQTDLDNTQEAVQQVVKSCKFSSSRDQSFYLKLSVHVILN